MDTYKKINIIGDIDHTAYLEFCETIDRLEKKPRGIIPIELVSDGGDAYIALAFADKIQRSKHEIHITVRGLVASAAVLILAAGDKRMASSTAWIMVHEDEVPLNENARVAEIEKDVKHARRLEHQWNNLLSMSTKADSATWARLHKDETYLVAHEALKLGLITEII
jgi:ATP-dependent protease ClpP protease subunit